MRRFPAFLFLLAACRADPPNAADLVLVHAAVYTVDSTRPSAEAVAIRGGRIAFVGSSDSATRFIGRATRVLDLAGRMVMPGLIDTHVHPVTGGAELNDCDLTGDSTRALLLAHVASCASARPAGAWVRGHGFELPLFPGGNPSRTLLDSLAPDNPALITSADGHNAWANSRALAAGGIDRGTPDPPHGRIERDASGAPSGTLRETAADLVSKHVPPYSDAEYDAGLARALALAGRLGITTWHEANASDDVLRAYARADAAGTLTVRTIVSMSVGPGAPDAIVAHLDSLRRQYATALVHPIAAKIFLDGVIEGGTAALLQPYLDRPGYRGELNVPPDRMNALVRALDSAGFKVHVHAIGDRAIRVALDAFEHRRPPTAGRLRPIIAHLQLFDPADIPRLASLGVVASFQPLWAYRDSYIRDLTEPRLGPARMRWNYPIASVVKTGAIVAAGSDWPVTSMNPLEAMQVAVTRRAPSDTAGPAWIPEERVDLATIVRAYTWNGAIASEEDSLIGTIAVGKAADLIVLSDNLFSVPASRISRARVLLTLFGGRAVYTDSTLR